MSDELMLERAQLQRGAVDLYSDRHFLQDHHKHKPPAMQHTL